jgi:hypothetical protein
MSASEKTATQSVSGAKSRTIQGEGKTMNDRPKSVLSDVSKKILTTVKVRIKFVDKIMSGCAKSGSSLDWYVNNKHMSDEEKADFLSRVKDGEMTQEEKDEVKDCSSRVFEHDRAGDLVIWHGNVKAMIRECAVTLGITQKQYRKRGKKVDGEGDVSGSAGGKQTVQHGIDVEPCHIKILVDGQPIREATGTVDRAIHIKGQEARSALGRFEFIDQPEMEFYLNWTTHGVVTEDDVKQIMALAEHNGLGACRSQGYGTFSVIHWEIIK